MTGERKRVSVDEAAQIERALSEMEGKAAPRSEHLVPLLGQPVEGDRFLWNAERPLDWVEAPRLGDDQADVLAVRMPGERMAPRLFSGERVYVTRGLPPERGKDCVAVYADGTAEVRTYEGRRDGFVFLRAYNPEEAIRVPDIEIKELHAVTVRL